VPDGPDRRERLLNLLATLLESPGGITQEELVARQELGYPPNPESARKAFERDKASLRAMGVPLRDEASGNVHRYRVAPADYYLPDLGLTPDELAALHVAVTAIAVGGGAGQGALMKLGGLEGEGAVPVAELPIEPSLPVLFEASRRRVAVRFGYRGRVREVEPWGLTSKFGRWYVVGRDRGADAMRVYRADRIEGDVEPEEKPSFTVPDGFRPADHLEEQAWHYGEGEPVTVRVRVDPGRVEEFLARAGAGVTAEPDADGGAVVTVPVRCVDGFLGTLFGFLEHAEVLGPPDVRARVVESLRAMSGASA
jgi:proteasome accessory factor B